MRARQRHLKPKSIGAFIALDSRYINQSDNTAVSSWADISGNSNNADQANATNQPTFQTAELGGNGVVRFDGSNDFLETPTITKNQPYTCFIVNYQRQLKGGGFGACFEDTGLGCAPFIGPFTGDKHAMYAGANLVGPAASLNVWYIGGYVFNGSSSKISINGGTATTGNAGSTNINSKFRVALNWQGLQYYDNDTAIAMVCEGNFSDALRKRCEHSAAYSFKLACS